MALAEAGNRVTLAYRRSAFSRIKAGNHERIRQLADARRITLLFDTTVVHISETEVELDVGGQRRRLPNALVFAMIGRELPYAFLNESALRLRRPGRSPALRSTVWRCSSSPPFTLANMSWHRGCFRKVNRSGAIPNGSSRRSSSPA